MADGPWETWPYDGSGPLSGRVLTQVEQSYDVEVFCVARPAGSQRPSDVHVLARLAPFTWRYELRVNDDPWGPTPSGAGDAIEWQSDDISFRGLGPGGARPRVDGPLAVERMEEQLVDAGLIPP